MWPELREAARLFQPHLLALVVMGSKGTEGKAAPLEKGGRQTGSPEFLARGQFQREGRVTI